MTALAQTIAGRSATRSSAMTDVLLVVAGSLVVAGLAQVSISLLPFTPVPITLQTLGVLVVGGALGAVRGGAALGLYLVEGLVGLPFYAEGESMPELLDRYNGFTSVPTGGYLIGFVIAAVVVGYLAERGWDRSPKSAISAMLLGQVITFTIGVAWLANALSVSGEKALEFGLYPFVIWDVIKLFLAAGLLPLAWKLIGKERTFRR